MVVEGRVWGFLVLKSFWVQAFHPKHIAHEPPIGTQKTTETQRSNILVLLTPRILLFMLSFRPRTKARQETASYPLRKWCHTLCVNTTPLTEQPYSSQRVNSKPALYQPQAPSKEPYYPCEALFHGCRCASAPQGSCYQRLQAQELHLPGSSNAVPLWVWYGFSVRTSVLEPKQELHWKVQVGTQMPSNLRACNP